MATSFNDFVVDGVEKIGKTVFDTLDNVAKSINPNGGLQPSIAGMNLNGFDSGNSFKDIAFGALKDKTFNFIKGGDGSSGKATFKNPTNCLDNSYIDAKSLTKNQKLTKPKIHQIQLNGKIKVEKYQ